MIVEKNGKIIAYASVQEPYWAYVTGKYLIDISVLPDFQKKGIGTKLYNQAMEILSEREIIKIEMWTRENQSNGIAFIKKKGYKKSERIPVSHLYVDKFDFIKYEKIVSDVRNKGIKLLLLPDVKKLLPDWKRKLWKLDKEISKDILGPDPFTPEPFEIWKKKLFCSPNFYPEGWTLALDGEKIVGISSLCKSQSDPKRLYVELTGVVRSHRRRGIATALKAIGAKCAQKYGAEIIVTDNDENNPMYKINLKLGFEPKPAWIGFVMKFK